MKVVIVGGGFGGLKLARKLNNKFRVPVRQETVHAVSRIKSLIIDKVINKSI